MTHTKWTRSLLVIALVLSAAVAQAQTKIKPGFNLFSPDDDVQVGQQSAMEAEQQLPILNDPAVTAYVNQIGQRLAANSNGPQFQYHFKVVNASDINAFALPGGFVYINRGVIDNARNEGELAGVMAHEISHVALRHGTHQASKAYLAQAGISILGGILGNKVGQGTAQIINAIGGFGLNALFLKYSRDIESQADVRGSQILTASGYTPVDMVNFFKTLERVDPSKKTNFLADHPAASRASKKKRNCCTFRIHRPKTSRNCAPSRAVSEATAPRGLRSRSRKRRPAPAALDGEGRQDRARM